MCLWKHRCVKIGAGLKNCSWGQVVTGAWILLSCILRLRYTKDTNLIFSPSNFQFLYFQIYEEWGLISCTHQSVWRAKNALQLRYTWFPAMSDLLRFEIWKVLLLENLCDVCLWKHGCLKIGAGLKNCSWGQVVTGAWILLSCILRLRYLKDTNFIFPPPNFQFLYFQIDEQWGLISCTRQSVWRAKNALQLRYRWFPAMTDLLRFEIWQVFFYSKIFVMCVYESIDAFKLAWVKELLLRSSGNGGVNFIMVHCMFAFYKRYKFYIFSPQIFSFSIFKSTSNGVSYIALINRFGGL